jgi:hypothetical protein
MLKNKTEKELKDFLKALKKQKSSFLKIMETKIQFYELESYDGKFNPYWMQEVESKKRVLMVGYD